MKERTRKVLNYFEKICEIPRPSGSEEKICNYLKEWAQSNGYMTEVDEIGNLIVECEEHQGFEHKPTVILQSHMDMVCIAEDGFDYIPETDAIKTYTDGDFLRAVGTSLGGDDGIGMALAQYLAADSTERGKLRLIFTADEEATTIGALNLSPHHLEAPYLINLDSEISDRVTISSAGCIEITGGCNNTAVSASMDFGFVLRLQGLFGGHSGDDIGKARLNSIVTALRLLEYLSDENIPYEVETFYGGTTSNSIPTTAVISGNTTDYAKLKHVVERAFDALLKDYPHETKAEILVEQTKKCENVIGCHVIGNGSTPNIVITEFALSIPNGVITVSDTIENLVTTSSNIGVLTVDLQHTDFQILVRGEKENDILQVAQRIEKIAQGQNLWCCKSQLTPSWEANTNNPLVKSLQTAYREVTGESLEPMAIHSVLECAEFRKKNESIHMVSISPDVYDVHSPQERLYIPSVEKIAKVMECLLKNI